MATWPACPSNATFAVRRPAFTSLKARWRRAPAPGDRVLAKIEPGEEGSFLARPFKTLPRPRLDIIVGVVEAGDTIRPTDKRIKNDFIIRHEDREAAEPGALVRAEIMGTGRLDLPRARILEVLGKQDDVGAISLVSAAEHQLRLNSPTRPAKKRTRPDPSPKTDAQTSATSQW